MKEGCAKLCSRSIAYDMGFDEVWLWNERPDRSGPDTDIDFVTEEKGGRLRPIQCKLCIKKTIRCKAAI